MKLISLNVGLFEANNEKLNQFLKEQKPDIVALQEVTRRVEDCSLDHFVSKNSIDDATPDLPFPFFGPLSMLSKFEQKNFHGHELFQFDLGGLVEFGNYVKTKYEITHARNVFVQNCFTYVTDMSGWPAEDYRAVEVVDMKIDDKMLRVLNYHGIWTRNKLGNDLTNQACQKIFDLATEVNYPSIICGDFNLFPDTKAIKLFESKFTSLVDTYNIQTTRPPSNELNNTQRNVIDYVLISKGIKVSSFEVLNSDVSDHLPLIVEFALE